MNDSDPTLSCLGGHSVPSRHRVTAVTPGYTFPPSQTAAASPPSILQQTHRGAMISLFPFGPNPTRPTLSAAPRRLSEPRTPPRPYRC